jgi:hypothetical protein
MTRTKLNQTESKSQHKKLAKTLSYIARTIILIVSSFWFIFALLSGAEQQGGGLMGVIKNSPNAIPWLLLFVFVFIAWRWPHIGGSLIAIAGIVTIFAFETYESLLPFVLISLPLIILGGMFIYSWYLDKKK